MPHPTTSPAWTDLTDLPSLLGGTPFKRSRVRARLAARLLTPSAGQSPYAVLVGRPGAGKTQRSVQYAWHQQRTYGGHCYLVDASSRTTLQAWIGQKAAALGIRQPSLRTVVTTLARRHREGPMLLVLDDAYDVDELHTTLRFLPNVHLLCTSSMDPRTTPDRVDLDDDTPAVRQQEGMHFVQTNLDGLTQPSAQALVERLHAHPLALALATTLLQHTTDALDHAAEALISDLASVPTAGEASTTPEQQVVNTVWRRYASVLQTTSPHALRLLETCAFLHGNRIPHALVERPAGDPFATPPMSTLMKHLLTLGVAMQHGHHHLTVHPMVQHAVRDGMGATRAGLALQRASQGLSRFQPTCKDEALPHVVAVATHLLDWPMGTSAHRRFEQAQHLQVAGEQVTWIDHQHHKGQRLINQAIHYLRSLPEPDPKTTAALSWAYHCLGNVERLIASTTEQPPHIQEAHLVSAERATSKAYTTLEALPEGPARNEALERLAQAATPAHRPGSNGQRQLEQALTLLNHPVLINTVHISSWWQLAQSAAAYRGRNHKTLQQRVATTLRQLLEVKAYHTRCGDQCHHLLKFSTHYVALCVAADCSEQALSYLKTTQERLEHWADTPLKGQAREHVRHLETNLQAILATQRRPQPTRQGLRRPSATPTRSLTKRRRTQTRQVDLRQLFGARRLRPAPPQRPSTAPPPPDARGSEARPGGR